MIVFDREDIPIVRDVWYGSGELEAEVSEGIGDDVVAGVTGDADHSNSEEDSARTEDKDV